METMTKINKMTSKEITNWQSSYNFASICDSEVEATTADSISLKNFDNGHQLVLNASGEVLVGDTILWYAPGGVKHFVPDADEAQLAKIKSGAIESKIRDTYSIGRLTQAEGGRDKSQAHWI